MVPSRIQWHMVSQIVRLYKRKKYIRQHVHQITSIRIPQHRSHFELSDFLFFGAKVILSSTIVSGIGVRDTYIANKVVNLGTTTGWVTVG